MKVVLGYSGGLDTSVIVTWMKENYDAEVICMAADVGQRGGLQGLEDKALATGATAFFGEDLRREFVEDFVWPTLRVGAVYSRKYLLGTAIARPLIARQQVEVARKVGAEALAHGCTGKGNDQVRFELTYMALAPDLKVIAPWREWDLQSREDAVAYAREKRIPVEVEEGKLYSRDENLWHISHEGGPLEDPDFEPEESMFLWTSAPEEAPDEPERVKISFEEGYPTAVDGEELDPVSLVEELNGRAARHGVGRVDLLEDRLVGMKSRGVYETPGGTLLHTSLREMEHVTLARRSLDLKDDLARRYADLVYEGRWWSPERKAMDAAVDALLRPVTGTVTLKLFKGSAQVVGRTSPTSLYDENLATFGDGGAYAYAHSDAAGFVKLFGLPLRAVAAQARGMASEEGDVVAALGEATEEFAQTGG